MAEGRTAWPAEPDGWYVEPGWATTFLLEREEIRGPVWDPCCGGGNIVKACIAAGLTAWGSDLRERAGCAAAPWWAGTSPFVDGDAFAMHLEMGMRGVRTILMNPPYGRALLAEAFIRHALELDVDKVCAFVNAKFLFGAGRAKGLFRDHPPLRVYPITPRPSCPPGQHLLAGGKAEGGVENYCWMVFSRHRIRTGTVLRWR